MAKKEKEYTCTVTFTEGWEKRVMEALLDIYYSRLERNTGPKTNNPNDESA